MNPSVTHNGKAIHPEDWEYSARQIGQINKALDRKPRAIPKLELLLSMADDTKRQLSELTKEEEKQVDQATD